MSSFQGAPKGKKIKAPTPTSTNNCCTEYDEHSLFPSHLGALHIVSLTVFETDPQL